MGDLHASGVVMDALIPETGGDTDERRRTRRLAAREFRPRWTVIGVGTALILLAGGGAATLEVVTAIVGEPAGLLPVQRWAAALRGLTWRDEGVLRTGAAVAAVGTIMLLTLVPWRRPRLLPLRGADPLMAVAVGRKVLQRSLVSAALGVPGIVRARVRVRGGRFRRRVSVRAVTCYRNPANLTDLVQGAVTARLAEIDLTHARRVDVRLKLRKD